MFTSIAASSSRSPSRDTVSLGLAGLLVGGAVLAAFAMRPPEKEHVAPPEPLPVLREIMLPPAAGSRAAANAAKPKSANAKPHPSSTPPVVPTPIVEPLADETAQAGNDAAALPGDGDAGDGSGNGDGEADVGDGRGPGDGSGDGGPKSVYFGDLQVKVRVQPRFPEAARGMGRSEERCVVRIVVNEIGESDTITPLNCPVLYRAAAIEAAEQWRWYPLLENGHPIRAQFDLNFVFRLKP